MDGPDLSLTDKISPRWCVWAHAVSAYQPSGQDLLGTHGGGRVQGATGGLQCPANDWRKYGRQMEIRRLSGSQRRRAYFPWPPSCRPWDACREDAVSFSRRVSQREQNQPKIKLIFNLFLFFKKKKISEQRLVYVVLLDWAVRLVNKKEQKKNKANQKKAAAQLGTHGFHCVFSLPLWWLATNLRCVISSRPCSSDFWLYVHANSYEAHE